MKIREMLLAGTFVTMMIISAYIIVPIGPVPITMQPLVVLLAGMLLGSRLSAVSICVSHNCRNHMVIGRSQYSAYRPDLLDR